MKKKPKQLKQPSPLKQFLTHAFMAIHDHFEFLKAQRELERLEYSVDFIIALMRRASQPNLKVTFTNVQGITIVLEAMGKTEQKPIDPLSTKTYADYMAGRIG